MILLEVAKVTAIVAATLIVETLAVYCFLRRIGKRSKSLYNEGWILTYPGRKPVAFSDSVDANIFAQQMRTKGMIWSVYAIFRGKIQHCGDINDGPIVD